MPAPAQSPSPAGARASRLQRLTISRRLLLLAAAFTLPLGAMLTLIDLNKDIAFTRQELAGNAYQRQLVAAFAAIADHQRLADAWARTPAADRTELQAARLRVDAAFASLAATDADLGARLQFTPDGLAQRKRGHVQVDTVRKEWEEASTAVHGSTPAAAGEAHAHLLTDLRTMTAHAGDTSNLILDPDLDSYYAMDMTLLALPQTQERTAALLVWLQQAQGRRLTSADRRQLAVAAAFLREADRDRVAADAATSLNEDAQFHGASESLARSLPPAVATYTGTTTAFIEALDAAVKKQGKADLAGRRHRRRRVAAGQLRAVAGRRGRARCPAAAAHPRITNRPACGPSASAGWHGPEPSPSPSTSAAASPGRSPPPPASWPSRRSTWRRRRRRCRPRRSPWPAARPSRPRRSKRPRRRWRRWRR